MSKFRLSTEQMASLSNAWITDHKNELVGIPQVAGILPSIEDAHEGLVIITKSPPPSSEKLREMTRRQQILDLIHDRSYRVGLRLVQTQTALAVAKNLPETEKQLEILEKTIYPKSNQVPFMSYEEEEGAALLLERTMSEQESVVTLAKQIQTTLPSGESISLLDLIEDHIAAAKELGTLERQKKKLLAESGASQGLTESDAKKARQTWIEMALLLEGALKAALRKGTATQQLVDGVLGPMREAEKEADRERDAERKKREQEKEAEKLAKQTAENSKEQG